MYTEFYKASQYIDLATVSSVFFGLLFTGVIAYVLMDNKKTFEKTARLPLEDDEQGKP